MNAGETFFRADHDAHLWVVVSDPKQDSESVACVNLTSYDAAEDQSLARNDPTCLLRPGDHPFVTKATCLSYHDALTASVTKLELGVRTKVLLPNEPVSAELLARIRQGAMHSPHCPRGIRRLLQQQGLV